MCLSVKFDHQHTNKYSWGREIKLLLIFCGNKISSSPILHFPLWSVMFTSSHCYQYASWCRGKNGNALLLLAEQNVLYTLISSYTHTYTHVHPHALGVTLFPLCLLNNYLIPTLIRSALCYGKLTAQLSDFFRPTYAHRSKHHVNQWLQYPFWDFSGRKQE